MPQKAVNKCSRKECRSDFLSRGHYQMGDSNKIPASTVKKKKNVAGKRKERKEGEREGRRKKG